MNFRKQIFLWPKQGYKGGRKGQYLFERKYIVKKNVCVYLSKKNNVGLSIYSGPNLQQFMHKKKKKTDCYDIIMFYEVFLERPKIKCNNDVSEIKILPC